MKPLLHLALACTLAACSADQGDPRPSVPATLPDTGGQGVRDADSSAPADTISDSDTAPNPDVVPDNDQDARSGGGSDTNDGSGDPAGPDAEDAHADADVDGRDDVSTPAPVPATRGVHRRPDASALDIRIPSTRATRLEVWFYQTPDSVEVAHRVELARAPNGDWVGAADVGDVCCYGLRAWGPNWPWDPEWQPGSLAGFVSDVDDAGNRFNPNKLLLDPWAREMTHDPLTPTFDDPTVYFSGPDHRQIDSAPFAPRGVIVGTPPTPGEDERPAHPQWPLRDDVIYEVHLRGLTMNDPSVPQALRGTYAGAALKAPWLAELGVTAVEFLPLHETQNDRNDVNEGTDGDNYWGYASLSFLAPDRRYASDQSPGGPTRELTAMVDAFHREGIKVFVDVVYNHSGEGGAWGEGRERAWVLSWRGLDNAGFYQTVAGRGYQDNNGVGPNLQFLSPTVHDMVLDSLAWWHDVIGVDGFRFDLASVLGNSCDEACFQFTNDALLLDISRRFARTPARPDGADLIAEPWGIGEGTYQVGNYPTGWAEWNDRFRISVRAAINDAAADAGRAPTPRELATRLSGSPDLFQDPGRGPSSGVGYVASHDGFTWWDLFTCSERNNLQPWPAGPSDGGSEFNQNWDHDGDEAAQRQAARNAMVLMMVAAGTPMFNGGDEFLRTQRCNNNAYNVDSVVNWLDWSLVESNALHLLLVRRLIALRMGHRALRPSVWSDGGDRDDDGLADVTWYRQDGRFLQNADWSNAQLPVLTWRVDADERAADGPENESAARSIVVVWNRSDTFWQVTLPAAAEDARWYRVVDTATWLEGSGNSHATGDWAAMPGGTYGTHARSMVVLVER